MACTSLVVPRTSSSVSASMNATHDAVPAAFECVANVPFPTSRRAHGARQSTLTMAASSIRRFSYQLVTRLAPLVVRVGRDLFGDDLDRMRRSLLGPRRPRCRSRAVGAGPPETRPDETKRYER